MFFPEADRPDAKLTPADLRFADRLRAVVVRTPGRVAKWRRSVWADEFRILRDELGRDAAKIDTILSWYEFAAGKARVPNIRSAAAFRRNFDWLQDLSKKITCPITMPTEQEELATRLFARLKRMSWGNGDAGLEGAVRSAVVRHHQMCKEWKEAVAGEEVVSVRTVRFVNWARGRLLSAESFLYADFAGLQPGLVKWSDWSGSWDGVQFSVTIDRFVNHVMKLAKEFGDPQCGRDFLAAVKP